MAKKDKWNKKEDSKILDVDASMQGSLIFKDPVNLRINGKFDGSLDTRGTLTIGKDAIITAGIKGEKIIISGKVTGDIVASEIIEITENAFIVGNVKTPLISIAQGAVLHGNCIMISEQTNTISNDTSSVTWGIEEVAQYLEVEKSVVNKWIQQSKIPCFKEENNWKFKKIEIDEWLAKENKL